MIFQTPLLLKSIITTSIVVERPPIRPDKNLAVEITLVLSLVDGEIAALILQNGTSPRV